jgi:hypothetical protein
MEDERYVGGMVVSADPIVTYSKRGTGLPLGIAGVCPQAFEGRKALHLVALSYTIEPPHPYREIAADLATLSRRLPDSRFVIVTNSEYEAYLLSTVGVASMMSSQLIFLNETVFRPLQCEPRFDAV